MYIQNASGTTGKIVKGREFVSFHDILLLWVISVMVYKLEYFSYMKLSFLFSRRVTMPFSTRVKSSLVLKLFLSLKVTDQIT